LPRRERLSGKGRDVPRWLGVRAAEDAIDISVAYELV
jgi:hypothetical protein